LLRVAQKKVYNPSSNQNFYMHLMGKYGKALIYSMIPNCATLIRGHAQQRIVQKEIRGICLDKINSKI
jgi:hypothetical protein